MSLTERQESLLKAIVKEYIKSASPVSSRLIEKKHDFGVCPATIRNDMHQLTEAGFLFQPHISAGRVPTDRGYRFFVDSLFQEGISELRKDGEIEDCLSERSQDILGFIDRISRLLAERSSSLVTIHLFQKDFFWKEGWEEILKEPEFEKKEIIVDFTEFIRTFERDFKNLEINSEIKVYIGEENPFGKTKNFSIISSQCCFPRKEKGIVSLLGPKRMSYDRNLGLINSIIELMEDF